MKKVRLGIIGMGGMGGYHARYLLAGKVQRCEVTAVCDIVPEKLEPYASLKRFDDSTALLGSGLVDAVLIATPHYSHTTIGIEALNRRLHVLVEKPISVHKADCQRLIAAHRNKKQVFAAMFQMRTVGCYQKIRQLVKGGELGEIRRVNWIITNWFRTGAYYASGGWRATWKGEGGGVLLNQCPHNLDLFQWIFGMPRRVRGFCRFGQYHKIEVEDDVTAYMEFPNGATAVFVTTTGESPGTNRLEIAGEQGLLVLENEKIGFKRNEIPMSEFSRTTAETFATPPYWDVQVPPLPSGEMHATIMQNFVDAILDGTPLIAPAEEGANSVELANAILFSSLRGKTVDLPLNARAYEQQLKRLIAKSKFHKKTGRATHASDFNKSFNK